MNWKDTGMRIAANGVWGNFGVASAALITGIMIDNGGWRMAFVVPGIFSILVGFAYMALRWNSINEEHRKPKVRADNSMLNASPIYRAALIKVSAIIFLTTAVSSIIFQSTTFALPKIFDERLQGLAFDLSLWLENMTGTGDGDVATLIGLLAFMTFAVASIAQLIVGRSLDRYGPRKVFMIVAIIQLVFFSLMPGLSDGIALFVALGFMLGSFGQIPINDYMIGKTASGAYKARIFGIRYVVSFSVLAVALPLIAIVYQRWGFDTLFGILAGAAVVIFIAVSTLPKKLPSQDTFKMSAE
jgi:MFS family permease